MSYPDWRKPLAILQARSRGLTGVTAANAKHLGIALEDDMPEAAALARIVESLSAHTRVGPLPAPTDSQLHLFAELTGHARWTHLTKSEASAWISALLARENADALSRFNVRRDDYVRIHAGAPVNGMTEFRVSSVGKDCKVYLRLMGGAGVYPRRIVECLPREEHDEIERRLACREVPAAPRIPPDVVRAARIRSRTSMHTERETSEVRASLTGS